MKIRTISFTLTIGLSCFPLFDAHAQLTGIDLYSSCNAEAGTTPNAFCNAYLLGFYEGSVMGQQIASYSVKMCLPSGVTALQLQLITLKAMKDHPELLNQTANVIVSKGMVDTYRCKPKQTPIYGQKPN